MWMVTKSTASRGRDGAARIPRHRHRSPASRPGLFTSRRIAATSPPDNSPRSSTSLPTTTDWITSGCVLASATTDSICWRFFSGLLDSHKPLDHLHAADAPGDVRHLFEPMLDGIGADAIGQRLQPDQIVLDLRGRRYRCPRAAATACRGTARRTCIAACRPRHPLPASATGSPSHHHANAIRTATASSAAAGISVPVNVRSCMELFVRRSLIIAIARTHRCTPNSPIATASMCRAKLDKSRERRKACPADPKPHCGRNPM